MAAEKFMKDKLFKIVILRLLIYLRLYPHIVFTFNPFKIYEFMELNRGLKFSGDEVILDIGCGSGLQTLLIGKRCKKVIGIDISEKAITNAKIISGYMKNSVNTEFYCMKIENANFNNEFFDKIFSVCVIEHIPDYIEVLKESHRILKKGGQMIFSVDALETIEDHKLIEKHKKQHFVIKYFNKVELKAILEKIGFKGIEIYPIFKSKFSKELFIKRINNNDYKSLLSLISTYSILKHEENVNANENKGIFLIVKCFK